VFENWAARRELFEDNSQKDHLLGTFCAPYLDILERITHEHVLHEISKLHDPSVSGGNINLSIAYMVEYGGWDSATAATLNDLKLKLDLLGAALKPLRNKVTAHNDLATILASERMGTFPLDADVEYFKYLQEFVNNVAGGPMPFNTTVRNDARAFVESLVRGARTILKA
jgi:hypothetical protein